MISIRVIDIRKNGMFGLGMTDTHQIRLEYTHFDERKEVIAGFEFEYMNAVSSVIYRNSCVEHLLNTIEKYFNRFEWWFKHAILAVCEKAIRKYIESELNR